MYTMFLAVLEKPLEKQNLINSTDITDTGDIAFLQRIGGTPCIPEVALAETGSTRSPTLGRAAKTRRTHSC